MLIGKRRGVKSNIEVVVTIKHLLLTGKVCLLYNHLKVFLSVSFCGQEMKKSENGYLWPVLIKEGLG